MEEERFDGIFMNCVQQSQGIEKFFENMFGFMRRKTDLFTKPDHAKAVVTTELDRAIKMFSEDKARQAAIDKKKAEVRAQQEAALKAQREAAASKVKEPEADDQCVEVTDEEANRIMAEEAAKKAGVTSENAADSDMKDGEKVEDKKDKGIAPNSGNGATTDKYYWEQTLSEVTAHINIPEGVTSKQLDVKLGVSKFSCGLKG
jgi:hypothetical protein